MAFLNSVGKMPSERDMFMSLVIGWISESRQDLRKKVGIVSREQEALDELRMAILTSSVDAGEKLDNDGGEQCGVKSGEIFELGENEEDNLVILSPK